MGGHVRELVDALLEAHSLSIMFLDLLVDLGEDTQSEFVLLFGAVGSSVFSDEVDELSLGISEGCGEEVLVGWGGVQSEEGQSGSRAGNSTSSKNVFHLLREKKYYNFNESGILNIYFFN